MVRCFTPVFGRHIIYAISEFFFDCHGQRAGMLPQTRCWSNMVNSPWLIVGNLWFTSHSGGLLSPCPIIQDYSSVSLYHQSLNHWKWDANLKICGHFTQEHPQVIVKTKIYAMVESVNLILCRNSLITEPRFKAYKAMLQRFLSGNFNLCIYIYTISIHIHQDQNFSTSRLVWKIVWM